MSNIDESSFAAQAKAARATFLLMTRGQMRTAELMEELGYQSTEGVRLLMNNVSLGHVPIWNPDRGVWAIAGFERGGMDETCRHCPDLG